MRIAIPVGVAHAALAALALWTFAGSAESRAEGSQQTNSNAAASFDCARAISAREKAICADPALSALDGQLARLYAERRGLLSPQGAKSLLESERSWLRFVRTVCSSDGPKSKPSRSRRSCLMAQYNERIEQLKEVALKIGPFVFNRVDLYAAQPAPDEDGASTGFYVQHVAYPQVDNANSPDLAAWNRQNVRQLSKETECDSPSGDSDTDYEVGYANARFISVQWIESTYCHGTPHGFGGVKSGNIVLSPRLRPLTQQDLFGSGEAWIPTLKERFWTALAQAGWSPPDNQPDVKKQLEGDFVQPDRWLFTKDGLRVAFESYEGGCYACTPQPVTLPWSELKPVLSKGAIAP